MSRNSGADDVTLVAGQAYAGERTQTWTEPIGVRIRQRREQHRVDQAEERRCWRRHRAPSVRMHAKVKPGFSRKVLIAYRTSWCAWRATSVAAIRGIAPALA